MLFDSPLALDVLLATAAFGTAVLSATLGMAGGLLLMGVYTAVLDVPAAMVLHGLTQLCANGFRAGLRPKAIHRPTFPWYILGAAVALGLLYVVQFTPDKRTVYLFLGLLPFVALLAPRHSLLDFAHRRGAALAGFLVTVLQLMAGVAGPILDVFFVRGTLDRHAVVSTKAATQTLAHALKIGWFFPLFLAGSPVRPATVALVLAGAALGTLAGGRLLDRWSEAGFRSATQRVVLAIGAVYLVRAAL